MFPYRNRGSGRLAWRQLRVLLAAGLLLGPLVLVAPLWAAPAAPAPAVAPTFTVNNINDAAGAVPLNDGICATAYSSGVPNGICTLRAAIMEANHWPGGGATVVLPALPSGQAYALTIPKSGLNGEDTGDLNLTANLTLRGAGIDQSIINDQAGSTSDRALAVRFPAIVTISGVTIEGGSAPVDGGGIFNDGTLTLNDSAIVNNTTHGALDGGGGIFTSGPLIVNNSLISGNQVLSPGGSGGGGLATSGHKSVLIENTIIQGNHSVNNGGGLLNQQATMIIVNSTIAHNDAQKGGGVYNNNGGRLSLANTTLSQNTAAVAGGGLGNAAGGITLTNSTVSGNQANTDGGGLWNNGPATTTTLSLYNATVADNQADNDLNGSGTGGGLFSAVATSNTVQAANSLLADNQASIKLLGFWVPVADDCHGPLASHDDNLLAISTGCALSAGSGDQTDLPAHLGPLRNNGGPTFTQSLLAGSPAIDRGNPAGCRDQLGNLLGADQRGLARHVNSLGTTRCDVGAFELQRLLELPLLLR